MTFQLDTSGYVEGRPQGVRTRRIYWKDLTPFAQGYVEAMFSDLGRTLIVRNRVGEIVGFRHLAPATVERIIADCERFGELPVGEHGLSEAGITFWQARQWGYLRHDKFPPLVPYLSDDGLIMLREVGE